MKIAFILPRYHTNLFFALEALTQGGYGVYLICAGDAGRAPESTNSHLVLDRHLWTYGDVAKLLNQLNPDCVIIRKTGDLSKIAHRVSALQRRKAISYDQRPYLRPRRLGQVVHGILNGRPTRRFTPVHGLEGSGPPDPRATYLPFPVAPMPQEIARAYAPGGVIRILCVAKLTEKRKNQFLLLRALEPLARWFKFEITLVGSSSLSIDNPDKSHFEALQDYASHGPLAARLTIRPNLPFSKMTEVYRNHDICVLPSRSEPLGTAPLEAMAQGCVAVISSEAGSAYYVQSAEMAGLACGKVFASGDEAALRDVLSQFMQHQESLRRLGENAAEWTRLEFNPEIFLERFKKLIS